MHRVTLLLCLVTAAVSAPAAARRCADESGFRAAQEAMDTAVPCDGPRGRYVKRAKRALAGSGLSGACRKRFVQRYIAQSTCGRGGVVCCREQGQRIGSIKRREQRCKAPGLVCTAGPSVGAACSAAGACAAPACGGAATPVAAGRFGSRLDAAEFARAPQALPVEALRRPPLPPDLPARVMLTNLPAVSRQGTRDNPGSPGSCEAQSFGYGLGSYTAARNPDGSVKWNPASPELSVSPAFLYQQTQREERAAGQCGDQQCICPGGSEATPYLARLIAFGAPSRAEVPYEPDCCYLDAIDLDRTYPEATQFRIGSFATFGIDPSQPGVIQLIKQYVANGQVVAFSGLVLQGYDTPAFAGGALAGVATVPDSGHGQIVVGYDDAVGSPTAPGAFLVQNSFGEEWPGARSGSSAPPGQAYWPYATFLATQSFAAVAYPVNPAPPASGALTGDAADAPGAFVSDLFQWAPAASSDVYLILQHHFTEPVTLERVTLRESGDLAAPYANYIADGYTYFRRTDGRQFTPGAYGVVLEAVTLAGRRVRYAGTVVVGAAAPTAPPAGRVDVDTPVFGTTGARATFTPAS